ncbi:hypothetical protein [Streptomyces olivaceus]|nr:hypothetical protein [Streptomyces olivaceus]MBZ6226798.1 hypothetical protein [Streptomyces olivaceus]
MHAGDLREQIYQWCAKRRLKGKLAQVLVRVCADVLATTSLTNPQVSEL